MAFFIFLAARFLIFAICCFSQRWPAANIILAFFSPSFSNACSRFNAALRLSLSTSISALAAALANFISSLAVARAALSVALVAFKSSRNCFSNARRELAAALRCCFAVFFFTAVFFTAGFLALAILGFAAAFFFTGLDLDSTAAFFAVAFLALAFFFTADFLIVGI
ncbi:MAG: hypothetical protein OEU50_11375 [Gammaproteobacteria bacterium]|nr:hypothetical protein [Gammaproteobacteria bacterium]